MKLIRWFLCKTNLYHRIVDVRLPLVTLGMTAETAQLLGCKVDGVTASCFACRYCGRVMTPVEVKKLYWHVSEDSRKA